MTYNRIRQIASKLRPNKNPLTVTQSNWQGVDYVDTPNAMQSYQIPFAQNVDFGAKIGAASKRGGLESLIASLGSGGIKGIHNFCHSSGEIPLVAWGTAVYKLSSGGGTITKTTTADFEAGTNTDTYPVSDTVVLDKEVGTTTIETGIYELNTNGRQVIRDSNGNLFAVYVKSNGANYQIYCEKSTDNGATWADTGFPTVAGYDQYSPSIALDSSNNIYVVWTGTDDTYTASSQIKFSKSADGGATWSAWTRIASIAFYDQDNPSIAIDSLNNIYVAWSGKSEPDYQSSSQIKFSKSADGGATWSAWKHIQPISNFNQYRPNIALDSSDNLYIVWDGMDDIYTTKNQIKLSKSIDNGETWSSWININPIIGYNCMLPSVSLDLNDNIYIVWTIPFLGIYHSKSTDGGATWTKADGTVGYDIVNETNINNSPTIGCYGNKIIILWEGKSGTYYQIKKREFENGSWTSTEDLTNASANQKSARIAWSKFNSNFVSKKPIFIWINDTDVKFYGPRSNYSTSGTWLSPAYDLTNTPKTATLSWTVTTPSGTSVTWYVRGSSDNAVWYDWQNVAASGGGIPLNRYLQVKAELEGTIAATPTVSDFTITYTTGYTTATAIKTGLSGNRVRFCTWRDKCYFTDGGRPQVYDGTSVRDMGVDPPATAPTLSDEGTAGNPNGAYYGKVTFVNSDGIESNPSGASAVCNVVSHKIAWSNIPTGPAGTASRKLYRTKGGGLVYYYVDTIADNTTTTYTDNIADSSLTIAMEDNNNIPPDCTILYEFMNYFFYVYAADESQVWFSKVGSPEQVPATVTDSQYKQFTDSVLGINATNDALVFHGENFIDIYTASDSGFIFDSDPSVDTTRARHIDKYGAYSHESIAMCVDPELRQIMVFPTQTGVRFLMPGLQEESLESVPLSRNIQPYYDRAVERRNMAAFFYNNYYLLAFTHQAAGAATATANNVIFAYDFRNRQWYGPWTINASCFAKVENDLFCGDSTAGKVYKMFTGSSDAGAAINMICDFPRLSPYGMNQKYKFKRMMVCVSADSVTTSSVVKAKVDNNESIINIGTLSSSFAGDERPGDNSIRSKKYNIAKGLGSSISYRWTDNSTNPIAIEEIYTEYEPLGIRT